MVNVLISSELVESASLTALFETLEATALGRSTKRLHLCARLHSHPSSGAYWIVLSFFTIVEAVDILNELTSCLLNNNVLDAPLDTSCSRPVLFC